MHSQCVDPKDAVHPHPGAVFSALPGPLIVLGAMPDQMAQSTLASKRIEA